ncbi:MAG: deacylase [Desulfovibrio sp.]|nr:deacylase [Desulfovibrio sp.]
MSNPSFRAGAGAEAGSARPETAGGEDLPARPQTPAFAQGSPDAPAVGTSPAPALEGKDGQRAEEGDVLPFAPPAAHFNLLKMGGEGPTLLVIGGIQGDEPGGFSAAALLSFAYHIRKGRLWVVPDLNFPSILRRSRGVSGDMNRKFAALDVSDPEFGAVSRIKSILLDEEVDLVLNLHDGSGFYRPNWEDKLRNPQRWGQSLIIDQEKMIMPPFLLKEAAGRVETEVNGTLLDPAHRYHIYNTLTAEGNKEMGKTLSWFSVRNGKPAFGIEASKEFGTEYRTYYHLRVVEAFMRLLGIEFERDFTLDPKGVRAALNSNILLSAFEDRVILHLDNVRPCLSRIPFKKGSLPDVRGSKPLLALVREKDEWRVAYGNNTLTRIKPEFMDFDESLQKMDLVVDGEATSVSPGEIVQVREYFLVNVPEGYRVNAIGAQKEVRGSEAGVLLRRKDFMPRFSLDKNASIFRVEAYKGKAFSGMILVRFGDAAARPVKSLTAGRGPESELGF